jgi:hypothetical protein
LLGLIAYNTKYWIEGKEKKKNLGIVCSLLALLWDSIVSISYIPSGGRGYSLESIPTLILDAVGLLSLGLWYYQKTKINEE